MGGGVREYEVDGSVTQGDAADPRRGANWRDCVVEDEDASGGESDAGTAGPLRVRPAGAPAPHLPRATPPPGYGRSATTGKDSLLRSTSALSTALLDSESGGEGPIDPIALPAFASVRSTKAWAGRGGAGGAGGAAPTPAAAAGGAGAGDATTATSPAVTSKAMESASSAASSSSSDEASVGEVTFNTRAERGEGDRPSTPPRSASALSHHPQSPLTPLRSRTSAFGLVGAAPASTILTAPPGLGITSPALTGMVGSWASPARHVPSGLVASASLVQGSGSSVSAHASPTLHRPFNHHQQQYPFAAAHSSPALFLQGDHHALPSRDHILQGGGGGGSSGLVGQGPSFSPCAPPLGRGGVMLGMGMSSPEPLGTTSGQMEGGMDTTAARGMGGNIGASLLQMELEVGQGVERGDAAHPHPGHHVPLPVAL